MEAEVIEGSATSPSVARGARHMAVDAAMLEIAARSGTSSFRLYRWAPSCLSLGRNEPALRRYDRDLIARRGIDIVRRPTGGRAVWHDAEVTYALAAPLAMFGGQQAAFGRIHQLMAQALRRLGADISLAPEGRAPGPGAGPCFGQAVGGELVHGGRKLVGSAQLVEGSALLQHGSILLDGDQSLVREVSLRPPSASSPGSSSLRLVLGRPVCFEEVAEAVADTFLDALGIAPLGPQLAAQIAQPADLLEPRFRDPAWTWRR